jgi:hypothetical protein
VQPVSGLCIAARFHDSGETAPLFQGYSRGWSPIFRTQQGHLSIRSIGLGENLRFFIDQLNS